MITTERQYRLVMAGTVLLIVIFAFAMVVTLFEPGYPPCKNADGQVVACPVVAP